MELFLENSQQFLAVSVSDVWLNSKYASADTTMESDSCKWNAKRFSIEHVHTNEK